MDVNSRCYKLLEEALDEVSAESSPYEVTNEIVIERYNKKIKEALIQEICRKYKPLNWLSSSFALTVLDFFES